MKCFDSYDDDRASCMVTNNSCSGSYNSSLKPNGSGGATMCSGTTDSAITQCTFYANQTAANRLYNGVGDAVAIATATEAISPEPPVPGSDMLSSYSR
jgi:hypothetical protein